MQVVSGQNWDIAFWVCFKTSVFSFHSSLFSLTSLLLSFHQILPHKEVLLFTYLEHNYLLYYLPSKYLSSIDPLALWSPMTSFSTSQSYLWFGAPTTNAWQSMLFIIVKLTSTWWQQHKNAYPALRLTHNEPKCPRHTQEKQKHTLFISLVIISSSRQLVFI